MGTLFMLIRYLFAISLVVAFFTTHAIDAQQPEQPGKEAIEHVLKGTAEVSFRIDPSGKVEILSIQATNQQLIDYVIKKLNKIQLDKGDPQIGQIIKYRFVFKKQT
jgi:hypothetical protein